MPLPSLVFFTFAVGALAALAGRVELRVSPRPAFVTQTHLAFVLFASLVVVPISAYFYIFHGDWFLLYTIDVATIPSAVALVAFVLEVAFGSAGFLFAASLIRSGKDPFAGVLVLLGLVLAAGPIVWWRDRLAVVGSAAEFQGQFGLTDFAPGPVLQAAIVMGAILFVGTSGLLIRLRTSSRRGE